MSTVHENHVDGVDDDFGNGGGVDGGIGVDGGNVGEISNNIKNILERILSMPYRRTPTIK